MSTLLRVERVSKKYSKDLKSSVNYASKEIFRSMIGLSKSSSGLRNTEFWALRDVNFELKRGEVLGILGHNGAGKSTLLKCIAGKLQIDNGSIFRGGTIGHLIEMSAGFMPTMSGHDNITVRGKLLGKQGTELERYVCQVREFAELGEFFDVPVQFYSSGMKARLGFASSSVLATDILIIDEVLAVGDLSFRMKCYERINEIARKAAVLFVSHSIGQVARLCERGLYLEKGRVLYDGGIQQAITCYQKNLIDKNEKKKDYTLNPELISFSLIVNDKYWVKGENVSYGSLISVNIDTSKIQRNSQIRVVLKDASQGVLMDWNSARVELLWPDDPKILYVDLGKVELSPGSYSIFIQVMSSDGVDHLCISESIPIRVSGKYLYAVPVQRMAEWRFVENG